MRSGGLACLAVAALALGGCGAGAAPGPQGPTATSAGHSPGAGASTGSPGGAMLRWPAWIHVRHPLDLAGPLRGGSLVLWAAGHLWSLSSSGRRTLFSRAYDRPGNAEPYIAVPAPGHRGCSFGSATVYALRLYGTRGVVAAPANGPVRGFARIAAGGLLDGIAFDETGRFGFRLLVTIDHGLTATLEAIDCHGRVRTITGSAPRVEGGIVVARSGFGPFTGDLIAPDEHTGRIWALDPGGRATLVARSGLPAGQDIGVESEVQLPGNASGVLLASDRLTPHNRHPGHNVLLRLPVKALLAAGVRPGDVLVATEGASRLDDVHCSAAGCRAREVATGPPEAHLEGHLAILP